MANKFSKKETEFLEKIISNNGKCPIDLGKKEGVYIRCDDCLIYKYYDSQCCSNRETSTRAKELLNRDKEITATDINFFKEFYIWCSAVEDKQGLFFAPQWIKTALANGTLAYEGDPPSKLFLYADNEETQVEIGDILVKNADDTISVFQQKPIGKTRHLYHTPCGDFEESETVQTNHGPFIFVAYSTTLNSPYLCKALNNDNFNVFCFDCISKLVFKENYEPYKEPDFNWIGLKVRLNQDLESQYTIKAISKNNFNDWICVLEKGTDLQEKTLSEMFDEVAIEGKPFGAKIEYSLLDL